MSIPIVNLNVIRRKNYKVYQIDYNLNGKRIRKIIARNKREAEIIRADMQQRLTLGLQGIVLPSSTSMSLNNLIDQYLIRKKGLVRSSTHSRYKNYFDGFSSFMSKYFPAAIGDIRLIKYHYLQECFRLLVTEKVSKNKPWHRSTVNSLRDLLLEMFNGAVDDKVINENPVSNTKAFIVPKQNTLKFYTDKELEIIYSRLEKNWVPFFKFLEFTGLRKNEIINLIWSNVSLNENNPSITITSTDGYQTKTGKSQTIRITKTALKILNGQIGKHPIFVFPSKSNNKIRKADPNEALNKALKDTGISGTVHQFRHTFASKFMMSGVGTIFDLANYLSHSDIDTTKLYTHLSPDHMKDITKRLDKIQK
jgi:integrase